MFILSCLISLNALGLTLDEAQRTATDNSPEIRRFTLEKDSARWGERKAFAGFLPKLGLEGRHLFNEKWEELELEFAGANFVMPAIQPYTSFGVEARWNIFDGMATRHEMNAASIASDAAARRLARAQLKETAETRTLFFDALGAQLLTEVAEQNVQTLEHHLNDVNARVRSGVSTRFDILRIEVQLEDAKTDLASARDFAHLSRAKLFAHLGVSDDGKPLAGKMPEKWNVASVEKISAETATRDDRRAQALLVEERAQLALAASAHWLPQVDLFGSHEWYNNYNHAIWQDDNHFKPAYQYGVRLTWSLFDGGAAVASQHQAELAQSIEREKLNELDRAIPVEVEDSKRRFTYGVLTYNSKLSSIRKAEEAVRLAQSGLNAGTRTNTEVLDAVVDLNRAKATAVRSQMEAIQAWGKLELAVGAPIAAQGS